MKTNTLFLISLALLSAAMLTLTSCSSTSTPPPAVGMAVWTYKKGVPGGVMVQTFKTTATVTAVDQAKRSATLQEPDGRKFTVKVGLEAVNFDQVRVGDQVTATLTEKVVAFVDNKEAPASEGAAGVVTRTPKDSQPGGLAAETIQMTAKVIAIDPEKRTATLWFDNGNTETLSVRDDVDMSGHKVGEQVVFRIIQMTAIWIEKPQ